MLKNSMETLRDFYERMGSPCCDIRVIHIAGTNGKGSVSAYLHSVLKEAGHRVGLFTSPHLEDIRERIALNGEYISKEDFRRVQDRVKKFQQMEPKIPLTYFENLYFMALSYYEEKKPDIIILETGLGGRLDATNSFPNPMLSIITSVSMDHMEYLGNTLEEIAGEKAGIIKSGTPVIYLAKNEAVSQIMEKEAENRKTPAYPVSLEGENPPKLSDKGIDFSFDCNYYRDGTFFLPTKALYQQENAALAIRALAFLSETGRIVPGISMEILKKGLSETVWRGRMQEILPHVFLDGAHNEDGIRALLDSVRVHSCKGKRRLLFSVVQNKDSNAMAKKIRDSKLFSEIVVAPIKGERAMKKEKLFHCFKDVSPSVFSNVKEAFAYCLDKNNADDILYISGSLYLAGEILTLLHALKGAEDDSV